MGGCGAAAMAQGTEKSKRWTSGIAGYQGSDNTWVCLTLSISQLCLPPFDLIFRPPLFTKQKTVSSSFRLLGPLKLKSLEKEKSFSVWIVNPKEGL